MVNLADISTEELSEILRQRQAEAQNPQPERASDTLADKLDKLPSEIKESVKEATSIKTIPLKAKTALLDVAISHLINLGR